MKVLVCKHCGKKIDHIEVMSGRGSRSDDIYRKRLTEYLGGKITNV